MINADKRVIQAFDSPDGKIIADFLNKCSGEKVGESLITEKATMYRAQGAAVELMEIVELAKKAKDILNST
jgi:hypothetical protein